MGMLGRTIRVAMLALAVLVSATASSAQDAPSALDASARGAVVAAVAEALRSRYIFPDVGGRAAAAIETALAHGDYDAFSEPQTFAERLTADLLAVTHDRHMRVSAAGAPMRPAGGPAPPPRPNSIGGVTRADRLADNIGYIEVIGFPAPDIFAQGAGPAMAALQDTRALIIDLRRNGGGSPVSVSNLISYFVSSTAPVHINTFIVRNAGTETFERREFHSSATPFAYIGKPIYVLTSNQTFSAGEEFAYDMQVMRLGILVGETTGGGANPGGTMPLPSSLSIFIPDGRAENPITRTNWEGLGVVPNIATPADDALKVALERLGVTVSLGDIESLSEARLFIVTPRTAPRPGAAVAARRLIEELARGEPNYDPLTEDTAETIRNQLPALQQYFSRLGAIRSLTFHSVDRLGADVFNVEGAGGSASFTIMLTADGRVALADFGPPRPAQ